MNEIINQEKFSEALSLLEDYENNKSTYDLEEAKLKLESAFRSFEFAYLSLENINYEDIFEEIKDLQSKEEVEEKKEEVFDMFFNAYYLALMEAVEFIGEDNSKTQELVSTLSIFQQGKNHFLKNIYLANEQEIEEYIETLQAISLPFDEQSVNVKGKGKSVKKEEDYDWVESLAKEELIGIVKDQLKTIEELKEENQQLKNQLEIIQEARIQYDNPRKRSSWYSS